MDERLVRMANQIARNLAVHGEVEAAAQTADHIAKFWDPRMRRRALELLGEDADGFEPIAQQALAQLHDQDQTTTL